MCGFVGMIAGESVADDLLRALRTIQHRGQDAAGCGTWKDGRVHVVKGLRRIDRAIDPSARSALVGPAGISHVRYPTSGSRAAAEDAQPFHTRQPGVLLAHNGNLTNVAELVAWLRSEGVGVLSQCDAEPLLLTFARALTRRRAGHHTVGDVQAAAQEVRRRVRGAYSVTAVLEVDGKPALVAFRDPHGIRPGVYGQRRDGAWMTASESVALDGLQCEVRGDLPTDAALLLRAGAEPVRLPLAGGEGRPCVFERVYFACPESVMQNGRVHDTRRRLGAQLAQEWRARGLQADVVVAVPDTSRPSAQALAEALGIPCREGFRPHTVPGRTFIMPDQPSREAALRRKLRPIAERFEGQRVLLVDDSIVRGTTMRSVLSMVRGFSPVEVHVAIVSPPVRSPCFYGIDMPSREELVASRFDASHCSDAFARALGADSLTFLSVAGLRSVAGPRSCMACFDGDYIVPVSADERAAIRAARRG